MISDFEFAATKNGDQGLLKQTSLSFTTNVGKCRGFLGLVGSRDMSYAGRISGGKGSPETLVRIEGDGVLSGVVLRILVIGKCVNAVCLMPSEYTRILCAGGVLVHGRLQWH